MVRATLVVLVTTTSKTTPPPGAGRLIGKAVFSTWITGSGVTVTCSRGSSQGVTAGALLASPL